MFVAGCVHVFCVYVCVCVPAGNTCSTLLLAGLWDTEPLQPHSWERRNLLGHESHLICLPLTYTASQSRGNKMDTQMINPRYTSVACASQPSDVLTAVTWPHVVMY